MKPIPMNFAAVAAVTLGLVGCATTQLDAQWSNPEYRGLSLRGATLLVACEASEPTLQRICEDQMAAQVQAQGAKATRSSELREAATAPATGTDPYQAAARRIGARAIVRTTLSAGMPIATQGGPTIGIGVGGGSGRSGGFGGISLPIGGARVSNAYSGETALIDPANGAIVWSGRATSTTAQDVTSQITELAKITVGAIKEAGFF